MSPIVSASDRQKADEIAKEVYCNVDEHSQQGVEDIIAQALADTRYDCESNFVNNIAAVLDADDIETFTALVMKAKRSPDLESSTRSALKSEMEIRREVLRDVRAAIRAESVTGQVSVGYEMYNRGIADALATIDKVGKEQK